MTLRPPPEHGLCLLITSLWKWKRTPCILVVSPGRLCLRSDNEEDRSRPSHNGKSGKEFKDEEETVTTKTVHIVQATETTATRKRGVPSKVVDLGAAAHYVGDKSPATTPEQVARCVWCCWCVCVCVCRCAWTLVFMWMFSLLQPAAPPPSSSILADLFMVDSSPSQPAATGTRLPASGETLMCWSIHALKAQKGHFKLNLAS